MKQILEQIGLSDGDGNTSSKRVVAVSIVTWFITASDHGTAALVALGFAMALMGWTHWVEFAHAPEVKS